MNISRPDTGIYRHTCILLAIVVLSVPMPDRADADIYRFVTIDGIETFTDAPVNKQAKVVIKETAKKQVKPTKIVKAQKTHNVSLNEVIEKTISASIGQQDNAHSAPIEPKLPPVGGNITSGVGMRIDPIDGRWRQHNGIDIAIHEGTQVTPVGSGVVVYSGLRSGYGNTVLIEHAGGMITLYAHNSRLLVSVGQQVDKDTVIALSGNTGRSTGPHLHFEAWQAGVNVTPAFMPGSNTPLPKVQLATYKPKAHFRKEIMSDGSILFTNLPSATH